MVQFVRNTIEKDRLIKMKHVDYYEFLQISPHADQDTIHRVYRFLAARFHPDNPHSGNAELFSQLKTAYDVLSNPVHRSEYDAVRAKDAPQAVPLSVSIDFMDGMDGELNRRLAVLAVLYFRRRANAYAPEVALAEIEVRMGFPRDYLDFTIWYLHKKGYITRGDNSDLSLTAQGVDFVETQRVTIPILNKLLTSGNEVSAAANAAYGIPMDHTLTTNSEWTDVQNPTERRANRGDRRVNAPDLRPVKTERRVSKSDRRSKE